MIHYLKKIVQRAARKRALGYLRRKYPRHIFGRGTYSTDLKVFSWGEGARLSIGNYCSIAGGVQIFLGGEHRVDWVTTYPFTHLWEACKDIQGHPKTKGDVIIGNDVWIGKEAFILSGVTIGDGAVIGARAVVGSDIDPYAISVGNPARVVRKRFDNETIAKLLDLKWWDWSEAQIERALPILLDSKVDQLFEFDKRRFSFKTHTANRSHE